MAQIGMIIGAVMCCIAGGKAFFDGEIKLTDSKKLRGAAASAIGVALFAVGLLLFVFALFIWPKLVAL